MPKILVTGANGFVGKHLLDELVDHGYDVIAIGGSQVAEIEDRPHVSYMTLELSSEEETRKINFTEVSGVIHLAGLAAVGPSFDDPMTYIKVNIGIEINIFETAMAQDVKPRFLVISSGTLYDAKAPLPLTETSSVDPNSPYAVSKMGQEQMAMYYHTRGFECIIARPFNHIGPGQGPGFIVPDLAQQIIEVEKGIKNDLLVGNLDSQRDYTDVRDIVRAYRMLLEKGKSGSVYNICSGKALSGHEILSGLLASSEATPNIGQDPSKMRPSDTPIIYGSNEKISQDTGWTPEIQLETTFADVMNEWRNKTS